MKTRSGVRFEETGIHCRGPLLPLPPLLPVVLRRRNHSDESATHQLTGLPRNSNQGVCAAPWPGGFSRTCCAGGGGGVVNGMSLDREPD